MDNDLFFNSGVPPPAPPLHFPSSAWHSVSAQSPDCFLSPNWERPNLEPLHFDSALSSLVSSPAASNSAAADSFAIRELIGKLGTVCNSGEISPHFPPTSSAATLTKPGPLNSPEFNPDPGFADRAARFSCFGTNSFNSRTSQIQLGHGSNPLIGNSLKPPLLGLNQNQNQNKNSDQSNSQEESTVSEQNPNLETGLKSPTETNSRKRKSVTKPKGKESAPTPPPKGVEAVENSNNKKPKTVAEKQNGSSAKPEEEKNQKLPEPPKDYIHVRARRGQATDSHSLAERVRREKISERMKLLQDLVPGCNKVTGKALMLDEIINYVQSLQRQVEFLSMKLASVNTATDFNMDTLITKDIFESNTSSVPHQMLPPDSSAPAFFGQNQGLNCNMIPNGTVDPIDSALCRNLGLQLPQLDGFGHVASQYPTFCQDDLQSIVQMGFGHNTTLLSHNVQGSNQASSEMKIEL